ncbi:hypothetical protein GCM10027422_24950 [Hymenobacter arcticus]
MKKNLFFAALFLAVTSTAFAQVGPRAQATERARIRQGARSGELTRPEAARLRAREANVTADKRAARADGVVTRGERHEIRGDKRRTSRAIYRQKHDGQVR